MLALLGEILLQLLVEVLLAPLFEGAVWLAKRSTFVSDFLDRLHTRLFPLSIITAVGVIVGAAWGGLVPARLLPPPPIPGLSLVLAPLAAGLMFYGIGRALAAQAKTPSTLFSFWGGAMFALGIAVARLSVIWTL